MSYALLPRQFRRCAVLYVLQLVIIRRCPSTVLCPVSSCDSADIRWVPIWDSQGNPPKTFLRGMSLSESVVRVRWKHPPCCQGLDDQPWLVNEKATSEKKKGSKPY